MHRGESKLSCRIINVHRAVGHDFGRYLVLLNTDRLIDRPTFQEHPNAGTCQCRFLSSLAAQLGLRGCAVKARSWSSGSAVRDHNLRGYLSYHAQTLGKINKYRIVLGIVQTVTIWIPAGFKINRHSWLLGFLIPAQYAIDYYWACIFFLFSFFFLKTPTRPTELNICSRIKSNGNVNLPKVSSSIFWL